MTNLPAPFSADFEGQIQDLARAHRRANGPIMSLVNRFGTTVEGQLSRLPQSVQNQIEQVLITALTGAHYLAGVADQGPDLGWRASTWAAIATGAAGGSGGLATALAELPVTITVFLHAIRREARLAGFDPLQDGIRAACLEVFAAASPLSDDDGINTAFLSARMTLTGPALQKLITAVAPRLATAMGQKLAAQAVPILGAASGAAINAAYLNYYRDIARIRFALMRLAEQHGGEAVVQAFARAANTRILKS
jgi:hypothetical protein